MNVENDLVISIKAIMGAAKGATTAMAIPLKTLLTEWIISHRSLCGFKFHKSVTFMII